jgi:hypothetical protein
MSIDPRAGARFAFFVLAGLVAGCQSATPTPTAPASASGVAPSAALPSPASVWGPLAVIPPQDGTDTSFTVGMLDITGKCVYLVANGDRTFLFWPSNRTRWIPDTRSISFANFDGTSATASDGDAVSIMGGGDSTAESGLSGEQWASRMVWVAPPDPSCDAELRWGAGGLKR